MQIITDEKPFLVAYCDLPFKVALEQRGLRDFLWFAVAGNGTPFQIDGTVLSKESVSRDGWKAIGRSDTVRLEYIRGHNNLTVQWGVGVYDHCAFSARGTARFTRKALANLSAWRQRVPEKYWESEGSVRLLPMQEEDGGVLVWLRDEVRAFILTAAKESDASSAEELSAALATAAQQDAAGFFAGLARLGLGFEGFAVTAFTHTGLR